MELGLTGRDVLMVPVAVGIQLGAAGADRGERAGFVEELHLAAHGDVRDRPGSGLACPRVMLRSHYDRDPTPPATKAPKPAGRSSNNLPKVARHRCFAAGGVLKCFWGPVSDSRCAIGPVGRAGLSGTGREPHQPPGGAGERFPEVLISDSGAGSMPGVPAVSSELGWSVGESSGLVHSGGEPTCHAGRRGCCLRGLPADEC